MTFDALGVAAIVAELRGLVGGRVQRVVQVGPLTFGLEVYAGRARQWLLVGADAQRPRAYLALQRPGQAAELVTPLLLLLRKHVRGSRLVDARQPGYERAFQLDFVKSWRPDEVDDDGLLQRLPDDDPFEGDAEDEGAPERPATRVALIIELVGRLSNVVLVDERGVVLDALKRIPSSLNRVRVTLPRHPYQTPPPQQKRRPDQVAPHELAALTAGDPAAPLWRALVAGVAGLSPQAAREVAFRAAGDASVAAGAADLAAVAAALAELVAPVADGGWSPSVAEADGALVAIAPYELRHLGDWRPRPTFSAAAADFFAAEERVTTVDQARAHLRARLDGELERQRRRVEALDREMERASEIERYRRAGDAILTHIGSIRPGQTELEADGERIELDPTLRPAENAQAYYRRYAKARDAIASVPEMREAAAVRLRYLEEQRALLETCRSVDEVRALGAELAEQGALGGSTAARRRRGDAVASGPLVGRLDGFEVLVGRSGRQNDEVTFRAARGDDLWLHARNIPGAHVIVRAAGREVPEPVVERAAAIAAHFSQAHGSTHVPVDVTPQRHVRKIKGAPPGMVTYAEERTLRVAPAPPEGFTTADSRRSSAPPSRGR